jgi:peptidyl-prolyl cis-trans isomerase D
MLQQLRKLSKSWVSSIFLLLIACSFAVWGIADIFRGGSDTSIATVGSVQIPFETFATQYRNFLRQETQSTGVDITPEKARQMGLGAVVLKQTIDRTVLDNVVAKLGLTASDADVSARIKAINAFNGPLGTFDHATFLRLITERGYTEPSFIAAMRSDTTRNQLDAAVEGGFDMPPGYMRALFAYATEVRAVQYIVVTPQAMAQIKVPDDATIAAYVKAHPDRFSTPEYRSAVYAEIGPDDVSGGVQVSEDQIKQQFETLKSDPASGIDVPEKRTVEQINFTSEADAKAARAKIDTGESFAAIAQERGLKPEDIALGDVKAADLVDKDVSAAVFSLPTGAISQPVKGGFGWVLVHVVKIIAGSTKTYDSLKDDIRKSMVDKLIANKLVDIVNVYTDAIAGGMTVEEAAKKAGMRVVSVPATDANGIAPDGSKTAATDPQLLTEIFKAEIGEEGDAFLGKNGHYYGIKVQGTTPPRLKSLALVRNDAAGAWIAEQTSLQLKQKATALAAQANKEQSLDGIAKTLGVSVQSSPALLRPRADKKPTVQSFSQELLQDIFTVGYGTTIAGVSADGNSYILARVSGIVHPTGGTEDPVYRAGIGQITREISSDITLSLANSGRAKQTVKINQSAVDRVVGGEGS